MSWPDEAAEIQPQSSSSKDEELFVFGYSCKVFRDDEKAEWVEEGKHLIPWMGDNGPESGLLIDRYDVRGALMDLKPYEAPPGGSNYLEGLTSEELLVEKLCDEERYRDFDEDTEYDENPYHHDQEAIDMDLGIQVERTRPPKEFGSVGYVYNDSPASIGPEPKKLEDELPYTRPAELMIPPDILLPATMKSHAIIEKTAKFIASQGTQMEIILKTKQAKNPLFDFLSHNDPLNPYYKFLVDAIKSNVYKPPDEIPYPEDSPNGKGSDGGSSDDEDGYLHPSLMKTSSDITRFIIPSGSFKPSINCAYSMLVSKIKEFSAEQNATNNNAVPETEAIPPCPPPAPPTYSYAEYPTQVHTMPSPQEQLIIDKMANYVVKNGPDFETMARTKGDPRFAFLDSYHEHNWYYVSCKERYRIEAQAVVASKGFVRYKEDDNGTSQKVFPNEAGAAPPEKDRPSVFQPPTLNKVNSEESRKSSSVGVGTRVKIKDPSSAKAKPEKEKLIKLPLSLPNFASVLKQASKEEDGENAAGKDKQEESEPLQAPKEEDKDDKDDAQKLKEERRKKAALFLQRLKKLEPVQSQTHVVPTSEVVSDVESIPSPSTVARSSESFEDTPVVVQQTKLTDDSRTRSDSLSKQEVPDILIERIKSSDDSLSRKDKEKIKDRHRSEDDRRSQSRRRSRSRHRRSRSSSLSDSNRSSSSSYSPKRKKSKRKHSKKSHKKRDRSRSKKSKKRRH